MSLDAAHQKGHAHAVQVPCLAVVAGQTRFTLAPANASWVALTLRVPAGIDAQLPPGAHAVHPVVQRRPGQGDAARGVRETTPP